MPEIAIYDASGGIVRWVSQTGDTMTFGQTQDCEPVIDSNAKLRAMPNNGKMMRRVASIPFGLIMTWLQRDGIEPHAYWQWPWREQQKYLKRKYQSSEYEKLRTA